MQMQEYVEKYDKLAAEESLLEIPLRKEYVLSKVGRRKKILDVGCLGGKFSKLMQEQNNEVWGVELNPAAAAAAAQLGIQVKVANVEDGLPFDNARFDVVNAGEILSTSMTRSIFWKKRIVFLWFPGGLFLFSTPNLNSFENRIQVARGGYLSMAGTYPEDHFGEHVRIFNLEKIRELCEITGFELVDVQGVPLLTSHGKWMDWSLGLFGKAFPSVAKLLLITARKSNGLI